MLDKNHYVQFIVYWSDYMFIPSSFGRRASAPFPDTGQGVVEYALILVLVAVIVIAVLTLLGDEVAVVFCRVTVALGGGGSEDGACAAPFVNCVGGTHPEAIVFDDKDDIDRVEFYLNGSLVITEKIYHYCMGGGDAACNPYTVPPGAEVTMIAYDRDGNIGQCSFTK
jgi:pilus assembly protein Flp/PilA